MKFYSASIFLLIVQQTISMPTSDLSEVKDSDVQNFKFSIKNSNTPENLNDGNFYEIIEDNDGLRIVRRDTEVRPKRALIFRPLFVYKQQQVKRQRVIEQRKTEKKPPTKQTRPRGR